MVVQDHDICTGGSRDGPVAECPAIDAEDQVMAGSQRLHRRIIRAIAFVDAVGDVERGRDAEGPSQWISNAADAPPSTS